MFVDLKHLTLPGLEFLAASMVALYCDYRHLRSQQSFASPVSPPSLPALDLHVPQPPPALPEKVEEVEELTEQQKEDRAAFIARAGVLASQIGGASLTSRRRARAAAAQSEAPNLAPEFRDLADESSVNQIIVRRKAEKLASGKPDKKHAVRLEPSILKELSTKANRRQKPVALTIPAGLHSEKELQSLLEQPHAFTGLVLAVEPLSNQSLQARQALTKFLENTLAPEDFLCETSDNGYVLLCPGVKGAHVHRRLGAISRRLWDHQLRDLTGKSQRLFWGVAEVRGDTLAEALTRANASLRSHKPQAEESERRAVLSRR